MVDYTVVFYDVVCYMIGYIRDINIITYCAVVKMRIVNTSKFGYAAVKGNLFVEFAKPDFA